MHRPRTFRFGSLCLIASLAVSTQAQSTGAASNPPSGQNAPGTGAPAEQTSPATGAPTGQGVGMASPSVGTGSGQVQTGATRVHGLIADPDGAAIPSATVVFKPSNGPARHTVSGPDGTYSLSVTPGAYNLAVTMKGFSSYSVQNVRIAAVPSMTLDAKLQVGETDVVVNVDANAIQLSVDPDSNADATVIQGKDLDALSDDPDELQSELEALAGPAAGPNGGQIYVDGFTGGQLPPKSSIREIRINQNPFSAEYDRIGYGRVEVFTKPGTDKYHGQFQLNDNPSQINSGNPLSGATEPPYNTLFMFGNLSGPLGKNASFQIGGSHRDIQDDELTNTKYPVLPGTTTLCPPGNSTCVTPGNPTQIFTFYPQVRTDISPRFDFALGQKNVLTTRLQYVQNDATNAGLTSGTTLPDNAYNSDQKNFEVQLSDTQTWSAKLINETRFEYTRQRLAYVPLDTAPQVTVSGDFTAGGNASYLNESDHQNYYEVQNYTSLALKKNFIRFGGRLRDTREAEYAASDTNGAFTYNSVADYVANTPEEFQLSVLNNPDIHYNVWDLGLYAEDDWKPKSNLTISYGLRFETQNHLVNDHDFAPRMSFAYGVGRSKTAPTTVIRGGFGIFYDRFGIANGSASTSTPLLNLTRYNGTNETFYTETSVPTGCSPTDTSLCLSGASTAPSSVYSEANGVGAPTLRAPYVEQFAGGFDQSVGKHATVSVNYLHTLGVHQLNIQDADYPQPAELAANPATPIPEAVNYQYFSEGEFHQDQMNVNVRSQTTRWLTLFGYYSLNFAKGDSSGGGAEVSENYDLQADLGRTTFDRRNFGVVFGSISLPKFFQVSPFIISQSGQPYNVTTGNDAPEDSFFNQRPEAVPLSMVNGSTIRAIPGCDLGFAQPGTVAGYGTAPINACTGPNLFTLNLRITKTIGFGEKVASSRGGGGGGGPHIGPGGFAGGGGGHGGFGGTSTGRRYSVTIGGQIQNLFNNLDPAPPIATLNSQEFGRSIVLQGGPYTQQSAVRRIQLQASFNF